MVGALYHQRNASLLRAANFVGYARAGSVASNDYRLATVVTRTYCEQILDIPCFWASDIAWLVVIASSGEAMSGGP